jgi:hypothetical protein
VLHNKTGDKLQCTILQNDPNEKLQQVGHDKSEDRNGPTYQSGACGGGASQFERPFTQQRGPKARVCFGSDVESHIRLATSKGLKLRSAFPEEVLSPEAGHEPSHKWAKGKVEPGHWDFLGPSSFNWPVNTLRLSAAILTRHVQLKF